MTIGLKACAIACAVWLTCGNCLAQSPPLELRGIALGQSTIDDVQSVFRSARTSKSRTAAFVTVNSEIDFLCGQSPSTSCMQSTIDNLRVAGGAAGSYFFSAGDDGRIEAIQATFPQSGFSTAKAGVVGKYGKPTRATTRQVRNRLGASFSGEDLDWDLPHGHIKLSEIGEKVDESTLRMESKVLADKAASDAERRLREAPGKL